MLFIQCRLIMRKILILFAVALIGFASCADSKQSMTVTVTNPLALERAGEMVEVPMSDVVAKLNWRIRHKLWCLTSTVSKCLIR